MNEIRRYNGIVFQEVISKNFEGIKVGIDDLALDFFINNEKVSDYFNKFLANEFICIQPGGGINLGESSTIRRWPVEYYIDLIKLIRSNRRYLFCLRETLTTMKLLTRFKENPRASLTSAVKQI